MLKTREEYVAEKSEQINEIFRFLNLEEEEEILRNLIEKYDRPKLCKEIFKTRILDFFSRSELLIYLHKQGR